MFREHPPLILLWVLPVIGAGCASQKTQSVEHPPTSMIAPEPMEGEATITIASLETAPGGLETEFRVHGGEDDAWLTLGLPGVAGSSGAPKGETTRGDLPVFPVDNGAVRDVPVFSGDSELGVVQAGSHLQKTSQAMDLPVYPMEEPEDLAEPDLAGPAGEGGVPSNTRPATPSPADPTPEKHEKPRPLPENVRTAFLKTNAEMNDTPEEPGTRKPFAWPRPGSAVETPENLQAPTDDVAAWLKGHALPKPVDSLGLLDEFDGPADAFAWLLQRSQSNKAPDSLAETRKQMAVLDWLARLQENKSNEPWGHGRNRDLDEVLAWFRKGGLGQDDNAPGQSAMTAATGQLFQWLGRSAQKNDGNHPPTGDVVVGADPLSRWLSQGQKAGPPSLVNHQPDQALKFPLQLFSVGKPVAVNSTGRPPTNPTASKLWLQSRLVKKATPDTTSQTGTTIPQVDYSAAFSWLRRASDNWQQQSGGMTARRIPSRVKARPRPSLTDEENLTEAMGWLRRGTGQRRHSLHAATGTDASIEAKQTP